MNEFLRTIARPLMLVLTVMLLMRWINSDPKTEVKKPVNAYTTFSDKANEVDTSSESIALSNKDINVEIDKETGNIVFLSLKHYNEDLNDKTPLIILDKARNEIARPVLQNVKTQEIVKYDSHSILEDEKFYNIILKSNTNSDIVVTKYAISKDDYTISIATSVEKGSGLYRLDYQISNQLKKSNVSIFNPATWSFKLAQGHVGASISIPTKFDYKKLFLDSFDKENFVAVSTGGWISMQKELFLTAIIPNETDETTFYTAKSADDKCIIGFEFKDLISENRSKEVTFYSGPEIREVLDSLAPNLSDTIDYGFLYYICIALFALISKINSFCSNWGLSIVLATVVIKIITYPLSLMAVKSKKKMSSISGKLSEIKEKYKDNPELYNQESMKLYKNANVNPFSGILSSLIPAPIFISLFWILNQSVELRMSSLFWIDDLSASDPYFILPALYSILMLIQQLYNNSAKLMSYTTLLPILFFALFSAMPAGVLLYFVTSSLISILTEKPQ